LKSRETGHSPPTTRIFRSTPFSGPKQPILRGTRTVQRNIFRGVP